jgi:hypothetical protein
MALTQQFARVTPDRLARCRAAALASPDGAPGWNPPSDDLLDADWSLWGLIRYGRSTGTGRAAALADLLDRITSGDPGGDIGFLDHPTVHDGFAGPPALLAPAAVAELARALVAAPFDDILAGLHAPPGHPAGTAASCGFGQFHGDLRTYLTTHFAATRTFFARAARNGMCVVVTTG